MSRRGQKLLERASRGILPRWMEAGRKRREHMERVATVLGEWADQLGLAGADRIRWVATGWLHDMLRDATASQMRPWLEDRFRALPESFWHGPVTAVRLAEEGVDDDEVLDAIRYHTLGHPDLGQLGRALIAADFLEPGRKERVGWNAGRRRHAPGQMDVVVRDVIRAKLERALKRKQPIRPEMVAMWNAVCSTRAPQERP